MSAIIHPTAIVDPAAEIADGVEIGPYCVIEAGVKLAEGNVIGPFCHFQGLSEIGAGNRFTSHCTIGMAPQHVEYKGEPTRLRIGARNVFREYVNIGRAYGKGETVIGDDNYFMATVHVGHDCAIGDRNVMATGAMFAGHVTLGNRAFVSGEAVVHQFCRIGDFAMLGGLAAVNKDIPPYMLAFGCPAKLRTINAVGLRRAGLSSAERNELKRLFRMLFASGDNLRVTLAGLNPAEFSEYGRNLIEFCGSSKRGISAANRRSGAESDDE